MSTISIPDPLAAQLRAVADEIGMTLEACINDVLQHFLEERENAEDLRDAKAAWEEYQRNPPAHPFTLDDALDRYSLTRKELVP